MICTQLMSILPFTCVYELFALPWWYNYNIVGDPCKLMLDWCWFKQLIRRVINLLDHLNCLDCIYDSCRKVGHLLLVSYENVWSGRLALRLNNSCHPYTLVFFQASTIFNNLFISLDTGNQFPHGSNISFVVIHFSVVHFKPRERTHNIWIQEKKEEIRLSEYDRINRILSLFFSLRTSIQIRG